MKKLIYSLVCVGGFVVAFVGLRVIGNALMGIGGILLCIYGLLEAMHAFSDGKASHNSGSMRAGLSPDEIFPPIPCPHCGADVPAGNEYCGKCGKKVNE